MDFFSVSAKNGRRKIFLEGILPIEGKELDNGNEIVVVFLHLFWVGAEAVAVEIVTKFFASATELLQGSERSSRSAVDRQVEKLESAVKRSLEAGGFVLIFYCTRNFATDISELVGERFFPPFFF